jgi:hypothetical protein
MQHAAPSPICKKGTGMGRHVGDMVPPSECPPPLPFVPALPPLRAMWHANGGVQRGGGGMQRKTACTLPLLLRGPHLCAPPLAHPLPPPRTGFVPPQLCAQTGNAGQRVKARPTPPFAPRPSPLLSRTEQGKCRTPAPKQGIKTRACCTTPASCAPCMQAEHMNGGGSPFPTLTPMFMLRMLRSVDRSVRRGRDWGCPECRWRKLARTGLCRSPYNGAKG